MGIKILREEITERVKDGLVQIIRFKELLHNVPVNLKIPHKA